MTFDADAPGVCPGCGEAGEIGAACDERVCQRWGLHRVPAACVTWGEREAPPQRVGQLVGKILVVQELGAGGFGMVYLGLQLPVFMPVALKVLHRHDEPRVAAVMLRKFEDEARALARLNHPNIVRLVDYGDHDGSPYLAMEYVPGSRNLKTEIAERVARGVGMGLDTIAAVVRQTGDGLIAAHKKRLLHRDIKPENLMLQSAVGHPILVRIVDFGLAKFTGDGTSTSRAMGTPAYMAPEQLVQKDLGPWTDLYALGVLTFELLTGRRPFAGRTTQEIVAQKIDPDYDPLSRAAGLSMPGDVRAFLKCAVAYEPKERFRNGVAFRAAFDRAILAYGEEGAEGVGLYELSALVDESDLQHAESARLRRDREAAEDEGASDAAPATPPRGGAGEASALAGARSATTDQGTGHFVESWLPKRDEGASGERSTSPGRPDAPVAGASSDGVGSDRRVSDAVDDDLLIDEGFRRPVLAPLLLGAGILLLLLSGLAWFILRTEERLASRSSGEGMAGAGVAAAVTTPDAGTTDRSGAAVDASEGAPPVDEVTAPSSPAGESGGAKPRPKSASSSVSWQQAKVRSEAKAGLKPKAKVRSEAKAKLKPKLKPKAKAKSRPKAKAKSRPKAMAKAKAKPRPEPKARPRLERVPAPVPEPASAPVPEPEPASAPESAPAPDPVPANAARLQVASSPGGARVSVNGRFKCQTPCAVTFKGKGPFFLKVERGAFEPWVRSYLSLDEVAREGGRLHVRLEMEL